MREIRLPINLFLLNYSGVAIAITAVLRLTVQN